MDPTTLDPPIREHTATRVRALLRRPSITHHQLQAAILADPGLALGLYREAGARAGEPIASIAHALSLSGIESLEKRLANARRDESDAYARLCSRAAHAAGFAGAWAAREEQSNPDEVLTAAVLQHAPELAAPDAGPVPLEEGVALRVRLAETLRFPYLARDCAELTGLLIPRARTVLLAFELARLSANGWYCEETLDLLDACASHLHQALPACIAESHRLAVERAHELADSGLPLSAFELAGIPTPKEAPSDRPPPATLHAEVDAAMRAMRDELGLERILFALLTPRRDALRARFVLGAAADDPIREATLPLGDGKLFDILMRKPQAVWVDPDNADGYRRYLPPLAWLRADEFLAVSLFVAGRPLGLFLADGWPDELPTAQRRERFARFQALCQRVSMHMAGAMA